MRCITRGDRYSGGGLRRNRTRTVSGSLHHRGPGRLAPPQTDRCVRPISCALVIPLLTAFPVRQALPAGRCEPAPMIAVDLPSPVSPRRRRPPLVALSLSPTHTRSRSRPNTCSDLERTKPRRVRQGPHRVELAAAHRRSGSALATSSLLPTDHLYAAADLVRRCLAGRVPKMPRKRSRPLGCTPLAASLNTLSLADAIGHPSQRAHLARSEDPRRMIRKLGFDTGDSRTIKVRNEPDIDDGGRVSEPLPPFPLSTLLTCPGPQMDDVFRYDLPVSRNRLVDAADVSISRSFSCNATELPLRIASAVSRPGSAGTCRKCASRSPRRPS